MAVEGNKEVLMLLDHIRADVMKGRRNAIGIITADDSGVDTSYVAQSGASEAWINLGVDLLKTGMMEKLRARQTPPGLTELTEDKRANKVIFNAKNLTLGYDFLAWLVAQEMRRTKHGIEEPLEVGFAVGEDYQTRPKDPILGKQHDFDHMMLNNVCLPLVGMIGAGPLKRDGTEWAPLNSCFRDAVDLFNEGVPIPRLGHTSEAAEAMKKHAGKVTITLREANHWTQRNSDWAVWKEIVQWLEATGEEVLIVRDTAKADEPLGGFETEPFASKDINCRAALYAGAKCNLFISNGPGTLDWFCGDAPSLTFIPLSKTDGYKCSHPDWWEPHHGIKAGDQFPWFPAHKRIVWERPTFEVVTKAYTELMSGASNKARAGAKLRVGAPQGPGYPKRGRLGTARRATVRRTKRQDARTGAVS